MCLTCVVGQSAAYPASSCQTVTYNTSGIAWVKWAGATGGSAQVGTFVVAIDILLRQVPKRDFLPDNNCRYGDNNLDKSMNSTKCALMLLLGCRGAKT